MILAQLQLDGANAGKMVRDEEPDFYEQGGLGA